MKSCLQEVIAEHVSVATLPNISLLMKTWEISRCDKRRYQSLKFTSVVNREAALNESLFYSVRIDQIFPFVAEAIYPWGKPLDNSAFGVGTVDVCSFITCNRTSVLAKSSYEYNRATLEFQKSCF
jgi:hypothetical protein